MINKKLISALGLAVAASIMMTVPSLAAPSANINDRTTETIKTSKAKIGKISAKDKQILRSIFDATFYAKTYPDIVKRIGNNPDKLFNYFISFGLQEGQQINADFNPCAYRSAYSDLNSMFGYDIVLYYTHYYNFGKMEGRNLTTVERCQDNGVIVTDFGGNKMAVDAKGAVVVGERAEKIILTDYKYVNAVDFIVAAELGLDPRIAFELQKSEFIADITAQEGEIVAEEVAKIHASNEFKKVQNAIDENRNDNESAELASKDTDSTNNYAKTYENALKQWEASKPNLADYQVVGKYASKEIADAEFLLAKSRWEASKPQVESLMNETQLSAYNAALQAWNDSMPVRDSYIITAYATSTEADNAYAADLEAWNNAKPKISDSKYSVGNYRTQEAANAAYAADLATWEAGKPSKDNGNFSVGYATAEAAKQAYDEAVEIYNSLEPNASDYVFASRTYESEEDALAAYNEAKRQYDSYIAWENSPIEDYDNKVGTVYIYNGQIYTSLSDANKAKAVAMPKAEGSEDLVSYLSKVNKYASAEEANEAYGTDKASYDAYIASLADEKYEIKEVYLYKDKYYLSQNEARVAAKDDTKPENVTASYYSFYLNNKGCSSQQEMDNLYAAELEKYDNNERETEPVKSDYVFKENKYENPEDGMAQYAEDFAKYDKYDSLRTAEVKKLTYLGDVEIKYMTRNESPSEFFITAIEKYLDSQKPTTANQQKKIINKYLLNDVKECVKYDGTINISKLNRALDKNHTTESLSGKSIASYYYKLLSKVKITYNDKKYDTILDAEKAAYDLKWAEEDDITTEPIIGDYAYYYTNEEAANNAYEAELLNFDSKISSGGYTTAQALSEDENNIYSSSEEAIEAAKKEAFNQLQKGVDGEVVTEEPDSSKYVYKDEYYASEETAIEAYEIDSANTLDLNYSNWKAMNVETNYYLVGETVENLTTEDISSDKDTMLNRAKENAKVTEASNPDAEGVKESQYTYYDESKNVYDSKEKAQNAYNEDKAAWDSQVPSEVEFKIGKYETEEAAETAYQNALTDYETIMPGENDSKYSVGKYDTVDDATTQLNADVTEYNKTAPNRESDAYSVGDYQTEAAAIDAYNSAVEAHNSSKPSIESYITENNKVSYNELENEWQESEPKAEDYTYDYVDTESYNADYAAWEQSKPQE